MIYTKEQQFAGHKRIYAEMFAGNTPTTFPKKPVDVEDIKNGNLFDDYPEAKPSDYTFAAGSFIYVVDTCEVYMYNDDTKKWVNQN